MTENELSPIQPQRSFTPQETHELQEMLRAVNHTKFIATQIKGNTALVPDGQKEADKWDAIARLLDNTKNQWVSGKLLECGYQPNQECSLDISTGEITLK